MRLCRDWSGAWGQRSDKHSWLSPPGRPREAVFSFWATLTSVSPAISLFFSLFGFFFFCTSLILPMSTQSSPSCSDHLLPCPLPIAAISPLLFSTRSDLSFLCLSVFHLCFSLFLSIIYLFICLFAHSDNRDKHNFLLAALTVLVANANSPLSFLVWLLHNVAVQKKVHIE